MLKLWYEREMDQALNIDTIPFREWNDPEKAKFYNRTEATPYQAIDEFFDYYDLPKDAHFVDIGCGSGRMAFYVHNRFNVPVTGVELNPLTFQDLEKNKQNYLSRPRQASKKYDYFKPNMEPAPLEFFCDYAEKFLIKKEYTVFYLFNPFTVTIFDKVIRNIENSIFENPRQVDLILYYPLYEVQQYIEKNTIFNRKGSVHLKEIYDDEYEKFIVYTKK